MNEIEIYVEKLNKTVEELNSFDGNLLDNNYEILKKAFDICYKNGIFKLYEVKSEDLDEYRLKFYEKITGVSGTLAFLAIQLFAANAIMKKNNFAKKDKYFHKKCGIAINHLRSDKTVVDAIKCDGGYKLNGKLTWCSGYKIFDTLLIGFHFDGNECEVMTPFKEQNGFNIGLADNTFVGYGLNTVNIVLDDFFVDEDEIVSFNSIGNYTKNKSVSKTVHMCLYALGYATLDKIKDESLKKDSSKKLAFIRDSFLNSKDPDEMDILRVELSSFVSNLITTAMIMNGGTSVLSSIDFQRYYKEIMMFNANGLNKKLKEMTKEKFLSSKNN